MENKICGRCKIEKPVSDFPLRKKTNKNTGAIYTWPRLQCYNCCREIDKNRYSLNPEPKKKLALNKHNSDKEAAALKSKMWREKNKEEISARRKTQYKLNADNLKLKSKIRYEANKEKIKSAVKSYEKRNYDKVRARKNKLHNEKKVSDIEYNLKRRLRGRVRKALISKATKAHGTFTLIGCDINFLINHLEGLFTQGMTWDNMKEWHIDHKKPCALFDMSDEAQQRECFHWSNLQPLWAFDNLKKWANY